MFATFPLFKNVRNVSFENAEAFGTGFSRTVLISCFNFFLAGNILMLNEC